MACRDPMTSLGPIEEPFNSVRSAVEIRAEADCPRGLLGRHRYGTPFTIGEFIAHDQSPHFGVWITGVRPNARRLVLARIRRFRGKADID